MIRVVVEIWPKGDKAGAREVGSATIVNVSKHALSAERPDEYEITAIERAFRDQPERTLVASFAHMPGDGALALLTTALHAIGKRPNITPPPASEPKP
jgi:DsbC/DsbD-like thiol-disulfide interchange protein